MPAADKGPKSSFELAMERLKKKDRDEGVRDRPVSAKQKAAIAELRRVYEAKLAEREILHKASLREAADREALERLEAEYRQDREHVAAERDRKIEEIRKG